MRMLWKSIKGSPYALARLVAVAIGIIVTIAGEALQAPGLGHVGDAFLGAAVAMFMDLLARQLQESSDQPVDRSPALKEFSAAIRNELSEANFYRSRQIIEIEVLDGIVNIDFRSDIVVIDKSRNAMIRRQNITEIPAGLRKISDIEYYLGTVRYTEDMFEQPTRNNSSDHISFRYGFDAKNIQVIEDNHHWASLVKEYQLIFKSDTYKCEVTKVRGKTIVSALSENPKGTFNSAGAAFPGEQVRWKLTPLNVSHKAQNEVP